MLELPGMKLDVTDNGTVTVSVTNMHAPFSKKKYLSGLAYQSQN